MGYFGDHGQLRWDVNQGVQYIVAWDVDDTQPNFNGIIEYAINQQRGEIAPVVQFVNRHEDITLINRAGGDSVTLTIHSGSTPVAEDPSAILENGPYYVALTKGYLTGNQMPNGDYVVADGFVTAIVPPKNRTTIVPESEAYEEEFEIEFEIQSQPRFDKLEICFFDRSSGTPDNPGQWKLAQDPDIGATVIPDVENQRMKVITKRLGQYVVTSPQKPPEVAPPQYATQQSILETISEAGLSVEAAGKAMQATARAVATTSNGTAPY